MSSILQFAGDGLATISASSRPLHGWMQLPGVALAFEVGTRFMCYSERDMSSLRPSALETLMVNSPVLQCVWYSMFRDCDSAARGQEIPFVSLYVSLFKSLRLELVHGQFSASYLMNTGYLCPVPMECLLKTIVGFTSSSRYIWEGRGLCHVNSVNGIHSSSSISGSNMKDHPSAVRVWLRMQLILLRSWFLLWVEMSYHTWTTSTTDGCAQAARDVQLKLMSEFLLECRVDSDSPLMEAVLQASSFTATRDWRVADDVRNSQACWERFSFLHVEGRMMPGCSNWSCLTMEGFSEATLPTQLCGGCKRARYCSTKCQRTAWKHGGHRHACSDIARFVWSRVEKLFGCFCSFKRSCLTSNTSWQGLSWQGYSIGGFQPSCKGMVVSDQTSLIKRQDQCKQKYENNQGILSMTNEQVSFLAADLSSCCVTKLNACFISRWHDAYLSMCEISIQWSLTAWGIILLIWLSLNADPAVCVDLTKTCDWLLGPWLSDASFWPKAHSYSHGYSHPRKYLVLAAQHNACNTQVTQGQSHKGHKPVYIRNIYLHSMFCTGSIYIVWYLSKIILRVI